MGSQHPSPNVENPLPLRADIFWLELSHHVMPKVLVLKAPRRHVCNKL